MNVIRVTKNDIAIIDFIVANPIDNSEGRASSNHLQQLLTNKPCLVLLLEINQNEILTILLTN